MGGGGLLSEPSAPRGSGGPLPKVLEFLKEPSPPTGQDQGRVPAWSRPGPICPEPGGALPPAGPPPPQQPTPPRVSGPRTRHHPGRWRVKAQAQTATRGPRQGPGPCLADGCGQLVMCVHSLLSPRRCEPGSGTSQLLSSSPGRRAQDGPHGGTERVLQAGGSFRAGTERGGCGRSSGARWGNGRRGPDPQAAQRVRPGQRAPAGAPASGSRLPLLPAPRGAEETLGTAGHTPPSSGTC